MANTITLKTSSYDGRYLMVTCTQAQDIVNNRSIINWVLSSVGGSVNYYAVGPTELTIGGQQVFYKKRMRWDSKAFPAAAGSVSGSFTWEHDTDGSASLEVKLSTAIYTSTNREVSGTWKLDKIPRGATLISAPNFTDEENATIIYSNPAGNVASELQAYITIDGRIALFKDIPKTGSSYTFSFTEEERNYLRSLVVGSNSKTVGFFLITTIGNEVFTSDVINKTFTVVNAAPTLEPTVKDTKSNSISLTGNANTMIRYYNDMNYSIGAKAYKGATIVSQSVVCGDITATASSGSLGSVVSNVFVFTATDSRNNTITKTITLPMVDYVPLTCDVEAKISLDSADGTKANITFTISGNYFNGSFGTVNNNLELYYSLQYGNSGGASVSPITIPATAIKNSTYSIEYTIPQKLDYKESYIVNVQANDRVYSLSSKSKTLKAVPVFDWGEEDFNFNVPVKINNIEQDYIVEKGTSGIWTYEKWNSGKAVCWGTYTLNTAVNTQWDGNVYIGSASVDRINYPFGFVSKPTETVSVQTGNYAVWLYSKAVNGSYGSGIYNVCRFGAVNETATFYLSFQVIGKWK